MSRSVMWIMARKFIYRIFVARRKTILLPLLLSFWCLFLWIIWRLATAVSVALEVPPPPDLHLDEFRRTSSLAHYMARTQVLIEPSYSPCAMLEDVPLIIMVASAPDNWESRQAVRRTWATHQPTYFVLGLRGNTLDDDLLATTYIEAKQYGDVILFDFHDRYQNLTLKTALMMHWSLAHCPQAQFMFKTDDDVLVNPWTMKTVLKDHYNAKLVGYRNNDTEVHRDIYFKFHIPRWMYNEDRLPQYLSGAGYLISGDYLQQILKTAHRVPLVHLEDVYFTYIVANRRLGLALTHDRRLNRYKPWLDISCAYWSLACTHGYTPDEMVRVWAKIKSISYKDNMCSFYNTFLDSDIWLY